jgi:hypothetical protein
MPDFRNLHEDLVQNKWVFFGLVLAAVIGALANWRFS